MVQPITPNDQFYCVTKNVIDPKVNAALWRLEITGLVKTRQTYRIDRLESLPAVEQETTLMCISNGLDAGLMSNALWKGVPMNALLNAASPLPGAAKVRLHGVDNYTDTFPLEKAMDPTTLVVYEMNGQPLADRHGFPARVIVPGYFGEKHVKWITRIEVTDESAVGFYEKQGWGPEFTLPTRSRFDQPDNDSTFGSDAAAKGVTLRGVAFGGDRGISRVEVSLDDGGTWLEAKIDYPGTKLTWVLWSFDWRPAGPDNNTLVVRATDGEGEVQELDEDRRSNLARADSQDPSIRNRIDCAVRALSVVAFSRRPDPAGQRLLGEKPDSGSADTRRSFSRQSWPSAAACGGGGRRPHVSIFDG